MLERLFKTEDLLTSPYLMTFYSFIIVVSSILISVIFFKASASILIIAFITIAFTILMYKVYDITEKDIACDCYSFFDRYSMIIKTYLKIFGSMVFIFAILYIFLPQEYKVIIFSEQISTINNVANIRDNAIGTGFFLFEGLGISGNLFWLIFLNNVQVLLAAVLLSFLYGSGAIFLNTYQASVLGSLIGQNIIVLFGEYNNLGVYGQIFAFAHGSYMSLGYLPHGIFEFLAYFLGAIAGGIISASFFGHYATNKHVLAMTIRDVFLLVLISVVMLIIGAAVESYLIL